MTKKYWVPALDKANDVLSAISRQPGELRLIDISASLEMNKSSLFSLLATMEELNWVVKDATGRYSIGSAIGGFGFRFLQRQDFVADFMREAAVSRDAIGETIQLARLQGAEVLYLAKVEAPSPVRLVSEPGMTFPAHQTALGKVLLADLGADELRGLYPSERLEARTAFGLTSREKLFGELERVRRDGFALDNQEAVVGFHCAAFALRDGRGKATAAVSCSVPAHVWETKKTNILAEIGGLAGRLSTTA